MSVAEKEVGLFYLFSFAVKLPLGNAVLSGHVKADGDDFSVDESLIVGEYLCKMDRFCV